MRCKNCGAHDQVDVCEYCGMPLIDEAELERKRRAAAEDAAAPTERVVERIYVVSDAYADPSVSPKSRLVAVLLCFFLGFFGAHRFYAGRIGMGLMQLLTFGGLGLWWLVDMILVLLGKMEDSNGRSISEWRL